MPFSFDSPFQTGSSIWSSQSQWIFTAPPYLLYMRLLGPKKGYLRLLYRCGGCYDTKNDTWGCFIAVEAATIQKTIPEAALSLSRLLRHKKRYLRLLYRCGGYYDTKNDGGKPLHNLIWAGGWPRIVRNRPMPFQDLLHPVLHPQWAPYHSVLNWS